MAKFQFSALLREPLVILGIIVVAFLCREAWLMAVFPMFSGQDEARHYNTIQWIAEGKRSLCTIQTKDSNQDKGNLGTYRFSEEIKKTSDAASLSVWRSENYHKASFAPGSTGSQESVIDGQTWSRHTSTCPPDIAASANKFSLFHWSGSLIERAWENTDIMVRFYLIRLMAVLLGAITVLMAYFAAREAGFSSRVGLLIAFILSLQPKLSTYTTNINYDTLLIPCFALFLWASLRSLRQGMTPLNIALLALAFGGAVLTKGTGLVLLAGLSFLIWATLKQKQFWHHFTLRHWLLLGAVGLALLFMTHKIYSLTTLLPNLNLLSLFEYLQKSVPKFPSSSQNFWGAVDWTEPNFGPWFVGGIWLIEALALFGLGRYLIRRDPIPYLPSKMAIFFILTLFIALQLGVRLHDWHVFQETGSLALGTPGRYFLPMLLPQLLLIAVGLGALMPRSLWFERSLLLLATLILTFHLYQTWLVILPRFYL